MEDNKSSSEFGTHLKNPFRSETLRFRANTAKSDEDIAKLFRGGMSSVQPKSAVLQQKMIFEMGSSSSSERIPLVSVGLMTYNRANFLPGVIDAWLSQTFTDFELVISDDASTDDTQKICEEYAKKDPRVRYFRQEKNLNAPGCYKFLPSHARGTYFMWASDDDLWDNRFLEDCVKMHAEHPELVMVFARMIDVDRAGNEVKRLDPSGYMPLGNTAYERMKKMTLFYFKEGKNQLIFGLWKRAAMLEDPLFGPHKSNDHFPYYWGFDNYPTFCNLARGPIGFVDNIRFIHRLRADYATKISRPFVVRAWLTVYHRFEKVFGTPYFSYVIRRILHERKLSPWQRIKLVGWQFYVMARLFFVRKI